jgi:hypothetical protein
VKEYGFVLIVIAGERTLITGKVVTAMIIGAVALIFWVNKEA